MYLITFLPHNVVTEPHTVSRNKSVVGPLALHVQHESPSVFDLHKRLGHPSTKVAKHVLDLCNVSIDVNKTSLSKFLYGKIT